MKIKNLKKFLLFKFSHSKQVILNCLNFYRVYGTVFFSVLCFLFIIKCSCRDHWWGFFFRILFKKAKEEENINDMNKQQQQQRSIWQITSKLTLSFEWEELEIWSIFILKIHLRRVYKCNRPFDIYTFCCWKKLKLYFHNINDEQRVKRIGLLLNLISETELRIEIRMRKPLNWEWWMMVVFFLGGNNTKFN